MSRPQFVRGEPCGCHPELRQWRQGWLVSQLNIQSSCFFARSVPGRHRSQYLRSLHRTIQSRYTAQTFQSSHAVKQEARMFATADKARFVLQYIQKCRSCMFLPSCSQGNCVTQDSYAHMFHRCACCTKDSDIRCVCSLTASVLPGLNSCLLRWGKLP